MKIIKKEVAKDFIFETLETFVTSFVILMIIYVFLAFPIIVHGASMEPNLETGQRIIVEKITKNFDGYKRGDIVVLHPPGNKNVDYVKRIIGLPGETIKINECRVFVTKGSQRFELNESYLSPDLCTKGGPWIREGRSISIPEDNYLVLGDNRAKSVDSRFFGLVSKDLILGKVIFRFWPLDKIGIL